MVDKNKEIELDPSDFKLRDYDNVRIVMPKKPAMSEDDVDAQLFEYVLSAGKQVNSIGDLDDAWVQANFDGLKTVADVRDAIKAQYDRELEFEYSNLKFQLCSDALLDRLEGEVPEETLAANVEAVRAANIGRLEEMHISFEQYLREENMTPEQYEEKLVQETLRTLRLNVALDIMADVLGMQVGNHELTEYLSAPDPEAFLNEIRENGQVENARHAAVRVKAMRRIVDTAIVEEEGDGEVPPDIEEEVVDLPDFDNLPTPRIKGAIPEDHQTADVKLTEE